MKSEQEVAISQIVDIVIGGTPKTSTPEYWGGTINWASAKDISNCKGRYIYETEKTITQEGLKNSSAKLLPENTIVITSRGTVGEMCLLPYPMAFNQTCYGLITKEGVKPLFLFYKLKTLMGKINSLSYGTVFDTITKRTFDDLRITLPSLPEQQKIASILSAFDDKIELNERMNHTLEEMASAIFKSWFVDFEPFPDGEFEYNEERDKEIPTGWEVGRLEDLVTISTKSIKPFEKLHTLYRHFSIPAFDEGRIPTLEKGVDIKSNKHVIEKDCVLVSKLNPRFPRVWRPSVVNDMTSTCSTEFIVYEGKREGWTDFLYWLFKSQSFSVSHQTI